ncbi:hypothetical protein [Paenibacillus terreus]|uniref:hypothetical protein n=1 Tax=Paenibacillus terreus TaxID=1387834 RepID=UPI0035CD3388
MNSKKYLKFDAPTSNDPDKFSAMLSEYIYAAQEEGFQVDIQYSIAYVTENVDIKNKIIHSALLLYYK